MSLKKAIFSTVAAIAISSSALYAAGANNSTIVNGYDGTGDFLIFPAYFANGDNWKTNIKVVNTNTTASIVARVVVRDSASSNEKRDFAIYLSPSDVFEADMTYNDTTGLVEVCSHDDSMILAKGNEPQTALDYFAANGKDMCISLLPEITWTEKNGAGNDKPIGNVDRGASKEVETFGYIEVSGMNKITGTVAHTVGSLSDTADFSTIGLNKHTFYRAYRAMSQSASTPTNDSDTFNNGTAWQNVAGNLVSPAAMRHTLGNNDIYGMGVIYADNANGKLAMTYPATALENLQGTFYQTNGWYSLGSNTQLANITARTISNIEDEYYVAPTFDTAIYQIERAFAKNSYYVTHYGDTTMDETALIAVQPTKIMRFEADKLTVAQRKANMAPLFALRAPTATERADFPTKTAAQVQDLVANYAVNYESDIQAINAHDQLETFSSTTFGELSGSLPSNPQTIHNPNEQYYVDVSTLTKFASGWVQFRLINPADTTHTVPSVPMVMTAKKIGGTNVTNIVYPQFKN